MAGAEGRSRIPPRERFAGTERVINLDQAFTDLPGESKPRQGHMQKALYRLGPATTAIFLFEKDGKIDQHVFEGEAIIHVISGKLSVRTSKAEHELGTHDVLLLDPGVPHDFTAKEETRFLMTYVLEE